jgi:hypothetical protein
MSRIEKSACKKFEDDLMMGLSSSSRVSKKALKKTNRKKNFVALHIIIHNTLFTYLSPFSCEEYSLA